jgi:hypothetical protein
MRVMVIVKATKNSEAGAMLSESHAQDDQARYRDLENAPRS